MKISLGLLAGLAKGVVRNKVRSIVYEEAENAKTYAREAELTLEQAVDRTANETWRRLDKAL